MKRIFNHTLILIMSITSIMYLINNISIREYSKILSCILIIPLILIPKLLNRLNFKLTENEKTLYYLFIFIAYFFGTVVNCCDKICFFDILVNILSGFIYFMFGLKILKTNNKKIEVNLFNMIFLLSFCFFITGCLEIIEFFGDMLFKTNFQLSIETGVIDTMEDMIYTFVGYLVTLLIYFLSNNKIK